MRSWFRSTAGSKAGSLDGLNLFFGALLGANLGTIQGMALAEYAKTVFILAATVTVVRMLSTSEQRAKMLAVAAVYALMIAAWTLVPRFQPHGIAIADLHRLAATLAIWVVFVLFTEFLPVAAADEPVEP